MTSYFLWDSFEDNLIREIGDGGSVVNYLTTAALYGELISEIRDGVVSYHHFDGNGNTLVLTDEAAEVTDTFSYSAFGVVLEHLGVSQTALQFGGQFGYFQDARTEVYLVRARHLAPSAGRWLSEDPLFEVIPAIVVSSYSYARQNPLVFVDPSGLIETPCLASLGKIGDIVSAVKYREWPGFRGLSDNVQRSVIFAMESLRGTLTAGDSKDTIDCVYKELAPGGKEYIDIKCQCCKLSDDVTLSLLGDDLTTEHNGIKVRIHDPALATKVVKSSFCSARSTSKCEPDVKSFELKVSFTISGETLEGPKEKVDLTPTVAIGLYTYMCSECYTQAERIANQRSPR